MRMNSYPLEEDPQAERELLLLRIAELEREKAGLERFAAEAAHELLTPLVMIDAYAATAVERLADQLDAESLGDLDALRRAAARSRQLVQTLLEHARARRRPLERHPVDVDAVLCETLILLGPEIRARGAVVEVGELPWVMGDGTLITAVFTNLLTNALKFGPRVGAEIRVVARQDPAGWRFYIKSEGRAIAPEDRERIFEPYRRGRDERRTRGTGLGLAICREIVSWHGGSMGVRATDGRHNAFWFTLPAP